MAVAGGAWQNSSNMRSALKAGPPRPEDGDRAFERPPPKGGAELFNPKAARNHAGANGNGNGVDAHAEVETAPDALAERVEGLSLGVNGAEMALAASPTPSTPPNEA